MKNETEIVKETKTIKTKKNADEGERREMTIRKKKIESGRKININHAIPTSPADSQSRIIPDSGRLIEP